MLRGDGAEIISPRVRFWLAVSALLTYAGLYFFLINGYNTIAGTVALVPVVMVGLLYGPVASLAAWLFCGLVRAAAAAVTGAPVFSTLLNVTPGPLAVLACGLAISHLAGQFQRAQGDLRESQRRLNTVINQMPAILWTTDRELRIRSITGAVSSESPLSLDNVIGMPIAEMGDRHPLELTIPAHARALQGETAVYDYTLFGRRMEFRVEPLHDDAGQLVGTIGVGFDVTAQYQLAEQLREGQEYFRAAFDHGANGMALMGLDSRWFKVNKAFCDFTGYTAEEMIALHPGSLIHPDDVDKGTADRARLLAGEIDMYRVEKRFYHKRGHTVWGQVAVSLVHDSAGAPNYFVYQVQDINARKQADRQLIHLAEHDPLTNLWNRRRFSAELEFRIALAREKGAGGAVIFLDLDGFKYVNDTLGHHSGDDLIRQIAHRLQASIGSNGTVARLGGDEFACLLPESGPAEALARGQELCAAVRQAPILLGDQALTISISGGLALFPEHGTTAEQLLSRADVALYRAKGDGRNRVHLFCPDDGEQAIFASKVAWEQETRDALEQGRLSLHGQPIMSLATGRVSHYELLLRMVGRTGEVILPGAFLDVAESSGLIHLLDRWVVREAIGLAARLQATQPEVRLAFNLSAKAFADDGLLPLIQETLAETGVCPDRMILEITETAAIADQAKAEAFVSALSELGCRFALDDFGAGFTSFSTLRTLPVHYLKIDGSFIAQVSRDPVNQRLVRAMAEMARALGKQTVAEFVDDEATMQFLRECQIDYVQGYHIGRPAPLEA